MNTLAIADETANLFQLLVDASIPIGPYQLHWLELAGVTIGVASAWLDMRLLASRWVKVSRTGHRDVEPALTGALGS